MLDTHFWPIHRYFEVVELVPKRLVCKWQVQRSQGAAVNQGAQCKRRAEEPEKILRGGASACQ